MLSEEKLPGIVRQCYPLPRHLHIKVFDFMFPNFYLLLNLEVDSGWTWDRPCEEKLGHRLPHRLRIQGSRWARGWQLFRNLWSSQLVSVHAEQVVDVAGSTLLEKLLHLMRKHF